MFAITGSGLGPGLHAELRAMPGVTVRDAGYHDRCDVVLFDAARGSRPSESDLGKTEKLFIEVGRALRAEDDDAEDIADRTWQPDRVQRALSAWAEDVRRLNRTMAYRLSAGVLDERQFPATELLGALDATIARDRPRWRTAGERADLDIRIVEYRPGRYACGLQLTDPVAAGTDEATVERRPLECLQVRRPRHPPGTGIGPTSSRLDAPRTDDR